VKFLIIDDEALVRRSLARALRAKGHEVVEAVDGTEGLKLWLETQPNLVFLDVLMPGMTGPEVLKSIGANKNAKVILMSAFSGEHNIQTAQQMGADLFLTKPFEDIFAVIAQAEEMVA
jgi:Response regulator containing CheY-like receiver, AAA-type ATPase, and DNA-binding domains